MVQLPAPWSYALSVGGRFWLSFACLGDSFGVFSECKLHLKLDCFSFRLFASLFLATNRV